MKTYFAKWPDGTISVLTARNRDELWNALDSEGDPACAAIYQCPEEFHIVTSENYTGFWFECHPLFRARKIKCP